MPQALGAFVKFQHVFKLDDSFNTTLGIYVPFYKILIISNAGNKSSDNPILTVILLVLFICCALVYHLRNTI